jgi:hypothetical protein
MRATMRDPDHPGPGTRWMGGIAHRDATGLTKGRARVRQMLYTGGMSVGFRPTEDDERIIQAHRKEGETTTDVLRRGLRSLERLEWEDRARDDMARLRDEDLSEEPPAWEYDVAGNIRVTGTARIVPARRTEGPGG